MPQEIAPCRMTCGQCEYYPDDCAGCFAIKGRAFWRVYTGEAVCDIYDCCVNRNHLPHCGGCDNLPCAHYDREDPTKSPVENAADHRSMMETLNALRKREEYHV